ncbi:DUF2269 domain-containing protein [Aliiroseovarius sp. KMU-50]|uniref:DUF2269 domain-containing protein n=1 Tax=Aliiroseovarius salicola TaxID=3009082 RepID=A0ABT4VYL3_9RHOB|nr:DUF2269 domain-containing protein [Aliiroseovarius sp. KMU-50]MDA5093343.1 DUF2269 domain-containing protein [Aliiroseovarius sp. KMU-50]
MDWLIFLRWAHILGAAVLMGTGAGIAFFMVMAQRSRDPALIAHVAGSVVVADTLFTATAAVIQPITGTLLAWEMGWSLTEPWLLAGIGLYLFVGLFWLPVVRIQIRLRDLARQAAQTNTPLPDRYHQLYRIWFAFGWPAFLAMLMIFWVMIARPELW